MKGGGWRVLIEILKLRDRYQVGLSTIIILILPFLFLLFLCTSAINDSRGLVLSANISLSIFLCDKHFCSCDLFRASNLQAHRWEKLIFHLIKLVVKFAIFR